MQYWGFTVLAKRGAARWLEPLTPSYPAPVIASNCCSLRVDGSTIANRSFPVSANCARTSLRRFASRRRRWLALRVLNRGEAVNALKRAIYVGRVASYQAKQHEEMQAVADALSLLANLVMAWNRLKMQSVLDRWNARRATAVPPELVGRIAPTRTEGINLRGVFTFPIAQYQAQLLPSLSAAKSRALGG